MKRVTSLVAFALAVLLAFSLCACGAKPAAPAPAASSSAPEASAPAPAATDWPKKPITMRCGFGAGGSTDLGMRALATALEKVTGVPVVVENVTGATGWVMWSELLKADPDGYTIGGVNIPTLFTGYLDPQQGRSGISYESFDFICNQVTDYDMLICKKGKYADMAAFMKAAEAEGGVTIGDVGANGNKHVATLLLAQANPKATLTPVHQKGWTDNYAALLGDNLDAVCGSYGEVATYIGEGNIEVLCVYNDERLSVLPDIPTCEELGFGAVKSAPSRGYFMPKGADEATLTAIRAAFKEALNDEAVKKEMESLGLLLDYKDGDAYMEYIAGEEKKLKDVAPMLGWK